MTVKILPPSGSTSPGKLADAEVIFDDGHLFSGMKLVGFSVWQRHDGSYNVTFPSRTYTVGGEKRSYALLRPTSNPAVSNIVKQFIVDAFVAHKRGTSDVAMAKAKTISGTLPPDPWS
jgi:hypothetical protein